MKQINNGAISAYYQTSLFKNYTGEDWLEKCASEESNQRGASCTILFELNNWKIPEDYPLKL